MTHQYVDEDSVKVAPGYFKLVASLWPEMRQHKYKLFVIFFTMTLLALSGRVLPVLIGHAIDSIGHKDSNGHFKWIIGIFAVVQLARVVVMYWHRTVLADLGHIVMFNIREKILVKLQSFPIGFFDRNPSGRLNTRATTDVLSLGEVFNQGLFSILADVLSLAVIFGFMLSTSPKLTAISMVLWPGLIAFVVFITRRIRSSMREVKRKLAHMNTCLAESINGMKVLQLYNHTQKQQKRFDDKVAAFTEQQLKAVKLNAYLWPAIHTVIYASLLITLVYGGYLVETKAISIGLLVTFLLHIKDFSPPFRQILQKFNHFQNSLASAERVFTLLAQPTENQEGSLPAIDKLHGHIHFENVSFRYSDKRDDVLRNFNLKVKAGEKIALIGRTGSGKSTVVSLLQRFYDYQQGSIWVDGHELRSLDRQSVRARIGVVQQEPFLFRGSIKENISFHSPNISDEQIINALEQINGQLILQRRNGIDSQVEERGSNLSLGEKQLIAFARVMVQNPDILILDEATANIDETTEQLIQNATIKLMQDRTCLIIAHRLKTISNCDRVITMQ